MRGDVISVVLFCYRLFHKLKIIFLKRFSLHALQALKDSISRHSLNVAGSILLLLPFLCLPNHQTYKHTPCRFYFSRDRQINDAPSYTRNIKESVFCSIGWPQYVLAKKKCFARSSTRCQCPNLPRDSTCQQQRGHLEHQHQSF